MPRWRAILLYEDAYKKRIQDTLIINLEARVKILEAEKVSLYNTFTDELGAERQRVKIQSELVTFESSLKVMAEHEARKFKRQRNWLLGGIGAFGLYGLAKVFVPP